MKKIFVVLFWYFVVVQPNGAHLYKGDYPTQPPCESYRALAAKNVKNKVSAACVQGEQPKYDVIRKAKKP